MKRSTRSKPLYTSTSSGSSGAPLVTKTASTGAGPSASLSSSTTAAPAGNTGGKIKLKNWRKTSPEGSPPCDEDTTTPDPPSALFEFEEHIGSRLAAEAYTALYIELSAQIGQVTPGSVKEWVLLAYRAKCSFGLLNFSECREDGEKCLANRVAVQARKDVRGPDVVTVDNVREMLVLSLVALGEYAGASTVLGAVLSDSASASSHLSDMKESLPHIEAFRNAVSGEEWEFAAGLLPKVEIFLKHSPLLLLSATVLLETGKAEEARAVLLPYVPSISPPPVLKGETILREEQMLRKNVESHFLLCNVLLAKASLYCGRLYINIAAELIQRCLQTNASFLPAMRVGNYIISLEDYISKYAEAMERKRYNLALDICEDALKLDAQNKKINATFHYERAQAFLHLQKPLSVIEECTQSLLHDPSVAKVYVTRAAALQDVMRFEEADLDRLMAIKLNRSYERVFNHRTGTKHSGTKANEKASKPEKFPWQVTLYDELGVTRDATTEVVKSTYKRLVLKYHPDKLTTEPKEVQKTAEEKFKKITHAYYILSDQYRRSAYDMSLPAGV